MSKLEFKITEIPEGQSRRELMLEAEDLDIDEHAFEGGRINLEFYRTQFFIRVGFTLDVEVELICDRSLDSFSYPVETDYEVVFKVDVEEETENENGAVRRFNFDTNTISIEEEVRDTILLEIPIKKLHPKFLDEQGKPKQFKEETFGDLPDEQEGIDPRWEKLKKLKNN
ncbi:MAG: DUF177 domain-containing protein [Balneolaceae bacterium]|nr:DUF177 domain-containing protein [Balneolaceae bacterium]